LTSLAAQMGRITIFSLDSCVHCARVKAIFEDLGWGYYNISLDEYPSMKAPMLQLTDRMTVPQVYMHERHLGGANDIAALHRSGELSQLYGDLVLNMPDPENPLLQRPDHDPVPRAESMELLKEPPLCIAGITMTYQELVSSLVGPNTQDEDRHEYLDIRSHQTGRFSSTLKCFTGENLVNVLMNRFQFPGKRVEAVEVATMLMQSGLFQEVVPGSKFQDSRASFYRLQAHVTPFVLNTWRTWNDRVGKSPMKTLSRCKSLLDKAMKKHTNSRTGLIAYTDISTDSLFTEFEYYVCEFQQVSLLGMDTNTRKAFCINLYNMMIYHAFVKVGVPNTMYQRLSFYSSVSYNLGGSIFSFDDLEHGVLRGNKRHGLALSAPFRRQNDLRIGCVLPEFDYRVHFALNCGGASCPAVKTFTPEAIDEELRLCGHGFLESDENLHIDTDSATITLSKIFHWYKNDFGEDKVGVLRALSLFLRGNKLVQMTTLLSDQMLLNRLIVKHFEYDWTTNADVLKTKVFDYRNYTRSTYTCLLL